METLLKIMERVLAHRRNFTKYFLVGISGVLLDIGLLYLAADAARIRPLYAVFFTQAIVIAYNFLLNKHWSFRSKNTYRAELPRYAVVMGWNYVFGAFAMWLGNDLLGINHLLVRLATIALAVAWNYLLYHYWVYRT